MSTEVSEKFKQWWRSQDDVERCRLIKDKAIEVNNNHKKRVRALDQEMAYGFNRTGPRGGRFTRLVANSQNATEAYLRSVDELQYMVSTL